MNLAAAEKRASTVTTPRQAAALYNDIEHELAAGGDGTEEGYEQGEQALGILERRFPGVQGQARQVTTPPRLSRGAKRNLDAGGHQAPALGAVPRRQHQRQARQPGRTPRDRLRSASQIHARPRSSSSGFGGPRFTQTGIPGAAESATQLLMRTLGGLAGLSFLYLLLTPRGSRAVQIGGNGVSHSLSALISPKVDPLRASSKAQAASRPQKADPAGIGRTVASTGQVVGNAIGQFGRAVPGGAHKPVPAGARTPRTGGTF